jgi:hypothetical protein
MSKGNKVFLLCAIPLTFVLVMFFWHKRYPDHADLLLRCLTPIGTISAVAFALYGDFLRGWFYPVQIEIQVLSDEERNQHADWGERDGRKNRRCYCHHLRVKNLTPQKTIINGRVWLKSISIIDDSRSRIEPINYAVPRLMTWAPSEYDGEKRTFLKDQTFDIGKTWDENEGFEFQIHEKQGLAQGLLHELKSKFLPGTTIECVFFVTAENYHEEKEFHFRILVRNTVLLPGKGVETSKVVSVDQTTAKNSARINDRDMLA